MWPRTYSARLAQWSDLRSRVADMELPEALSAVNTWWAGTPWNNFYLHWDDRPIWPDPWQLLHDNIYCSLARGLGIMYTLALVDRSDVSDATLIESGGDNVVMVSHGFVLNYHADQITDIDLDIVNTPHQITLEDIQRLLS